MASTANFFPKVHKKRLRKYDRKKKGRSRVIDPQDLQRNE